MKSVQVCSAGRLAVRLVCLYELLASDTIMQSACRTRAHMPRQVVNGQPYEQVYRQAGHDASAQYYFVLNI